MLSEDEIEAVLLGLRYVDQRGDAILTGAAASALAKIGAVLSPKAQAALAMPLSMPGPDGFGFPENTVPLMDLRAAIRSQVRLDIAYIDGEHQRTERFVWPFQLGFMDNARVLAAWCEMRTAFRFFRTDRILSAVPGERYPRLPSTALISLRYDRPIPGRSSNTIAANMRFLSPRYGCGMIEKYPLGGAR